MNPLTKDQRSRLHNMVDIAVHLGHRAIQRWGAEAQRDMAIEECAELITSLQQEKRGRDVDVRTEVADVLIMVLQLVVIYGANECLAEVGAKTGRLEARLDCGAAR